MRHLPLLSLTTLGLCLTFAWSGPLLGAPAAQASAALPAGDAAAESPKEPTPKATEDDAASDKLDKQINMLSERMSGLMNEEMSLTMQCMDMQQRANGLVENPDKAAEDLTKGSTNPKLREYKQILVMIAQKVQAIDNKYLPLQKTLKTLERDRERATTAQKARIDELGNRLQAKHKANVEKIAGYYEKAGEPKPALQLYAGLYQAMPEKQRDRLLKERISSLSEKCGNYKDAVAMLKSILDALPEKDRYRDRQLGEKLGGLYEKAGDDKNALATYKAFLEAMPANKRDTDGKGLKNRIANLEKKGPKRY